MDMLKRETKKHFDSNEGQMAGGLVGAVIGIMVVIIILIAAVIPTVNEALSNAALTGTTKTVTDLIPLFLGIAGLVITVSIIVLR